ncbi:hypothetical protein EV192_106259 [Actinocrispum wychmicini]|uniref:Uncharacterized protein n=1 Tax=Actinocrispum wychmicini TaxID=1213861 RepID=A0A4R2JCZ8_9PSEU|nr:hypothetical protein EV192_106259 [Actinocrispum wychmicini]
MKVPCPSHVLNRGLVTEIRIEIGSGTEEDYDEDEDK